MNYRGLQEKAKKMGLKYVGVSKKDLDKMVNEVEIDVKNSQKKLDRKINVAIIRNGKHEVRRYTVDIHGENFVELAKEFAKSRGYKVELIETKPGITCPDCGKVIYV